MENSGPKMHWIYLLCGGFIIGITASICSPLLWSLQNTLLRIFGGYFSVNKFLRRCWGYW